LPKTKKKPQRKTAKAKATAKPAPKKRAAKPQRKRGVTVDIPARELKISVSPGKEFTPARIPKRKRSRQTRTIDKRGPFLAAYTACGCVDRAAKAVHIDRSAHYHWMKEPAYFAKFQEARAISTQTLEDKAVDLALRGLFEPNIFQGRFIYPQEEYVEREAVVGPRGGIVEPEKRAWRDVPGAEPLGVWRPDTSLLALLLRGRMRETYGTGALEVTGPGGGAIEIVQRLHAARERAARRMRVIEGGKLPDAG
jgi:hypothetical protein